MKDLRIKIEEILIKFTMDYPFYRGSACEDDLSKEAADKLESLFKSELKKIIGKSEELKVDRSHIKKCDCDYVKGKRIGMCLRCAEMRMDAFNRGENQLRKEIREKIESGVIKNG